MHFDLKASFISFTFPVQIALSHLLYPLDVLCTVASKPNLFTTLPTSGLESVLIACSFSSTLLRHEYVRSWRFALDRLLR